MMIFLHMDLFGGGCLSEGEAMLYAGFWRRFGAYCKDQIIISFIGFFFLILWVMLILVLDNGQTDERVLNGIAYAGAIAYYFVVPWLYYALLESSRLRGTFGKFAVGILVVDVNHERLSFGRATARFWSKVISAMILCIGFIMCGFTERKQGLHDLLCNTYSLNRSKLPATPPSPEAGQPTGAVQ